MDVRKILVVDDDEDILVLTQLCLSSQGNWEVILSSSGRDAVEKARTEKPDIILLDVCMPGMDGPATLTELRRQPETQAVPVVFLSAGLPPGEAARLKELGCAGSIRKPFELDFLAEEIRRIAGSL
jgi:CheY-like chemotaxis protein